MTRGETRRYECARYIYDKMYNDLVLDDIVTVEAASTEEAEKKAWVKGRHAYIICAEAGEK